MPQLAKALKKSYGQVPGAFEHVDPVEQLREHVWVSPYYEDNLTRLRDVLGAERVNVILRRHAGVLAAEDTEDAVDPEFIER